MRDKQRLPVVAAPGSHENALMNLTRYINALPSVRGLVSGALKG